MRNKILILIIVSFLSFLIGRQIFMYNKYHGNLIVYISNQTEKDTVKIEMNMDDVQQINEVFTNERFHNYKGYPMKVRLGKHRLLFKAEGKSISKEIKINTLFMRWVIVDLIEGDSGDFSFYISKQNKPLIIE